MGRRLVGFPLSDRPDRHRGAGRFCSGWGLWQMQRLEWKEAAARRDRGAYCAAGDPAAAVAGPDRGRRDDRYLRRPASSGQPTGAEPAMFLTSLHQAVGARGYRLIIQPFETEEGRTILVDRGLSARRGRQGPCRAQVQDPSRCCRRRCIWPDEVDSVSRPRPDLVAAELSGLPATCPRAGRARSGPTRSSWFCMARRVPRPRRDGLTPLPVELDRGSAERSPRICRDVVPHWLWSGSAMTALLMAAADRKRHQGA